MIRASVDRANATPLQAGRNRAPALALRFESLLGAQSADALPVTGKGPTADMPQDELPLSGTSPMPSATIAAAPASRPDKAAEELSQDGLDKPILARRSSGERHRRHAATAEAAGSRPGNERDAPQPPPAAEPTSRLAAMPSPVAGDARPPRSGRFEIAPGSSSSRASTRVSDDVAKANDRGAGDREPPPRGATQPVANGGETDTALSAAMRSVSEVDGVGSAAALAANCLAMVSSLDECAAGPPSPSSPAIPENAVAVEVFPGRKEPGARRHVPMPSSAASSPAAVHPTANVIATTDDRAPVPFASASPPPIAAATETARAGVPDPTPATDAVGRHLDLAREAAWLDRLASDIAASASGDAPLRFALSPERLGRLTIELSTAADGTAVRLTADTREAHRIVTEAQPQLVAEARAQGLRISGTQVDLGSSRQGSESMGGQGGDEQQRRPAAPPFADARPVARATASPPRAARPGRSAPDLYA